MPKWQIILGQFPNEARFHSALGFHASHIPKILYLETMYNASRFQALIITNRAAPPGSSASALLTSVCLVGCLEAPLASTCQMPGAPPAQVVMIRNVSRHCQRCPQDKIAPGWEPPTCRVWWTIKTLCGTQDNLLQGRTPSPSHPRPLPTMPTAPPFLQHLAFPFDP